MAGVLRTTVLIWADVLALYAIFVTQTYLTDVWKISVTHAAAIVNVFSGLILILPIPMKFFVDIFMGNYAMLLLSSLAFSVGLGFLSMSTPPVLSHATGTCSAYNPECVGNTQKILFYVAMSLISVGMSGHVTSLKNFAAQQGTASRAEEENSTGSKGVMKVLGGIGLVLVLIAAVIGIPYIKPWSVRFGVPAIFSVVATIIFLAGSCTYQYVTPPGRSELTSVIRVLVAASLKLFYRRPTNPRSLYGNHDKDAPVVPHTRGLGCLDKAAIILPSPSLEDQEKNRWRLCKTAEVEEAKSIVRMVPMSLTIILIGVVSSVGNTYFIEQANNMNRKVGVWKIPLPVFLWFYNQAKPLFAALYTNSADFLCSRPKYVPPVGIAVSIIFAVLCCITAAKVETRRIHVIRDHGLLDKPDDTIPMTVFWLLPQYLLLGGLDGISQKHISGFFKDQAPESMSQYVTLFVMGVLGAGNIGSVLSVYVVGKISERGGKPNWFQDTLNRSHLDNYYWVLAGLSAVNLVLYIAVALWYDYKDPKPEDGDEAQENGDTNEPNGDSSTSRCCFSCCRGSIDSP